MNKSKGQLIRRRGVVLGAASLLLAGCNTTPERHEMMTTVVQQRPVLDSRGMEGILDPVTGKPIGNTMVRTPTFTLDGVASGRTRSSLLSSSSASAKSTSAESDFLLKADVFWKLNWFRQQIHLGKIPIDFELSLSKTEKILEGTTHNQDYKLGKDALGKVEEWMAHHQANDKLRQNGINPVTIPWSAGQSSVQQYIDSGRLGFGRKEETLENSRTAGDEDAPLYRRTSLSTETMLSSAQKELIALVTEYAKTYSASPTEMQRRTEQKIDDKIEVYLQSLRRNPAAVNHPGLESREAKNSPTIPNYPTAELNRPPQ